MLFQKSVSTLSLSPLACSTTAVLFGCVWGAEAQAMLRIFILMTVYEQLVEILGITNNAEISLFYNSVPRGQIAVGSLFFQYMIMLDDFQYFKYNILTFLKNKNSLIFNFFL